MGEGWVGGGGLVGWGVGDGVGFLKKGGVFEVYWM